MVQCMKERMGEKNKNIQAFTPAGANRLTSEKSGIETLSRSLGRPLLLAALLRKLATDPELSYIGHQGAQQNNRRQSE